MRSERSRTVLLKNIKVVLTRVEEVLKNWQDKLQCNAAPRSPKAHRSVHRNVQQQQQHIELECEESKKVEDKLNNIVCWLTKRENYYKKSIRNLEKENVELRRNLVDLQRKRDQAELANNVTVSKLQDEITLLRAQGEQFGDEHKQQLMLQDKQHQNEILKYKRLLKDTVARALPLPKENNSDKTTARRSEANITQMHPAFIDETEEQKIKCLGLEVHKGNRKKRKLFQRDNETIVDII